jgi:hypothetical protein
MIGDRVLTGDGEVVGSNIHLLIWFFGFERVNTYGDKSGFTDGSNRVDWSSIGSRSKWCRRVIVLYIHAASKNDGYIDIPLQTRERMSRCCPWRDLIVRLGISAVAGGSGLRACRPALGKRRTWPARSTSRDVDKRSYGQNETTVAWFTIVPSLNAKKNERLPFPLSVPIMSRCEASELV